MTAQGLTEIPVRCGSGDATATPVATYDDNDGSGGISSGDTIRFNNEACGDAVSDFRMEVAAAEISDSEIVALAGSLDFSTTAAAESGADGTDVEGSLELNYEAAETGTTLTLAEVDTSVTSNGRTDGLTEGRLEEVIADSQFTVDFAGHMDSDALGGAFDFDTETAFAGSLGSFPTDGELELDAVNSGVLVKPSANTELKEHADFQIDTGGTGQYGAAETAPWLDLMSGSLFNWYPLLRALFIDPPNPLTTDSLIAVPIIYNPQGNDLSLDYEWRVDNQVFHSAVWPYVIPVYFFPAGFTRKDNEIEVRLTATEGEKTVSKSASTTVRNSPPALTLTLSPEQPETTDDIVLNYDATDADDDELTTRQEWRINNEVISDETGKTLPADRHKKHDVISVAVTTGDGEAETQAEANVTIEDGKPRIAVADLPETVTYGHRVEFDATVSDPDGDDVSGVRFAVDYGPVGMTVDPVTGRVAWTVEKLPMFDREMEVGWQVGSSGHSVEPVAGTLLVVDPNRQYPLMRTGITEVVALEGLQIADLDGDGDVEMLMRGLHNGVVSTTEWNGRDYTQSWAYPFDVALDAVRHGDIDADGHHEIFLLSGNAMTRLDGVERRPVASATVPPSRFRVTNVEVSDLNNDGTWEVIYVRNETQGYRVVVLSAEDLSPIWESPPGQLGNVVQIGNVDHDPSLEIIVSGGHVYDGSTFVRQWSHESALRLDRPHFGDRKAIGVGDIDGDGIEEVIGALDRSNTASLQVYSISSGEKLGDITASWERQGGLSVADIDGDDVAEVLVASNRHIAAYRYAQPAGEFTEIFSEPIPVWTQAIGVGDVDSDGAEEIVVASESNRDGAYMVARVHPEFEVEWTQPPTQLLAGNFVGGRLVSESDAEPGQPMFVAGTGYYDRTRVVHLSPSSGELTIGPSVNESATVFNNSHVLDAYISDYDRDGSDELFLAMYDDGEYRLVAFDPFRAVDEWSTAADEYTTSVSGVDLREDGLQGLLTDGAAYDVLNDSVIWDSESREQILGAAAGDLDGDGRAEIVAVRNYFELYVQLIVYSRPEGEATFAQGAVQMYEANDFYDIIVSDTDGNGESEVLLLAEEEFNTINCYGVPTNICSTVRRLDSNLELLNTFPLPLEDDPDRLFVLPGSGGRKHLVVTTGSRLTAYDAATGGKIWESPKLIGSISPNSLHYFEDGGEARLVIGTSEAMYITR